MSALWTVPHNVDCEFLHHPMGPLSLSIRLTVASESQLVTEESRNRRIEGTSGQDGWWRPTDTTRSNASWRTMAIEQVEQSLRIGPVCRVTVATNGKIR